MSKFFTFARNLFLVKLADNGMEIKQLLLFKYLICFGNVSNKFGIVMTIYNLIEKLLENVQLKQFYAL